MKKEVLETVNEFITNWVTPTEREEAKKDLLESLESIPMDAEVIVKLADVNKIIDEMIKPQQKYLDEVEMQNDFLVLKLKGYIEGLTELKEKLSKFSE